MTRDEVRQKLLDAIAAHFNSDGRDWGVSVGLPPDTFGQQPDHPDLHHFMVTIRAPLNE